MMKTLDDGQDRFLFWAWGFVFVIIKYLWFVSWLWTKKGHVWDWWCLVVVGWDFPRNQRMSKCVWWDLLFLSQTQHNTSQYRTFCTPTLQPICHPLRWCWLLLFSPFFLVLTSINIKWFTFTPSGLNDNKQMSFFDTLNN
jgi:hypothetical protein